MIDEAFARQQWRETHGAAYRTWAEAFKQRVEQSLRQWSGKVGYAAGPVTLFAG